ncbi:1-acyl-sn-glycerol-3-phosphate acyltransferase [Marinobacter daepoensis]|uniref:1-acyl-sn-glycerol-3-phosphate acyltransferase n=1 Tax=Marinobacter daepoensis TaxID=262077 RepID=A0ABS3BJD8_9GAMM|nr:lysophospholipid acyltransferase family protein [Marinobacter daepoensis]MBN7771460.1 1-acyl-sn-glycerol-3-phosphate acyltransferase [Marinobacter daepoensis]MBY6034269.1 1-acyl-sn-glycerol-3-phosphate acyltransferase [Marinobacter daepoensis]MBY6080061.1 1-acyl-sn-glycerol-3-phosphate acyltransferase [Marinobacter daepoensis]
MSWFRLTFRLFLFSGFLIGACALAASLRLLDAFRSHPIDRSPWATLCFRRACQCLGWQIQVYGRPSQRNALIVANHISWSDIPVLGSITPMRFLSKAEVGNWPVIGWLARQAGTLFIKRGAGQARSVKTSIARCLDAGESVLIYPEGTTSTGVAVLPMHGLLMSAALASSTPIQPVTIGYRRDKRPDALAPFIGDDSFHHHLFRLLKQPPGRIVVILHPPLQPDTADSLHDLTASVRQSISDGLTRIHSGEFDGTVDPAIRTEGTPELPRLR